MPWKIVVLWFDKEESGIRQRSSVYMHERLPATHGEIEPYC